MDLLHDYQDLLASISEAQRELDAGSQELISLEDIVATARTVIDGGYRSPIEAPVPEPGVRICPCCRQQLSPGVRFCRHCGAPVGKLQQLSPSGGLSLIVPGRSAGFPLDAVTSIGRESTCELRLDDSGISGQHAMIERYQGAYWIRDLDSTNGVFVNGKRIQQAQRLALGDQIRIGDTLLTVAVASAVHAQDATLYCLQCGRPLSPNVRFCAVCGAPVVR